MFGEEAGKHSEGAGRLSVKVEGRMEERRVKDKDAGLSRMRMRRREGKESTNSNTTLLPPSPEPPYRPMGGRIGIWFNFWHRGRFGMKF